MSYYFNRLSSALTESTVWTEPYSTRVMWISMLATADQYGRVFGAVPGLARRANVTLREAETALATFLAPDPYSRTTDFEGRRIEVIDGGWRLLNHGKYRGMKDHVHVKAQAAERQRRRRAKQDVTQKRDTSVTVTTSRSSNASASVAETCDQLPGFAPEADLPRDLDQWFGSGEVAADGK
jgi:hypothetical protein